LPGILALVVVVVIVLIVVAVALPPLLTQSVLQPRSPEITVTDFKLEDRRDVGCLLLLGGKVRYIFNLVNTGASGFAQVYFYLDDRVVDSNNYYVPGGGQYHVEQDIQVNDCLGHEARVSVVRVWT
jgi:hypothetical protein